MNNAESHRAVEIVWQNKDESDEPVSRPNAPYAKQVFFESSTKSHAISQREAEAEAAAKMRRDREAAMKRAGIPIPEPGEPTHRLESGVILIGDRVFGAVDGGFAFRGDGVALMAAADPVPGSRTAEVATHGLKNPPKLVPLNPLSPEERKRLDWLRSFPYERSEGQREADDRMRALLLEQLAKLS
jgi:hypothetical protein